jgi:biopolymer transport protein ExbD
MRMKRFDTINVIPLIDVMLVLLAIVLTTASFIVKDNLQIDLPATQHTETYVPPKEQPPMQFNIDAGNRLFLGGTPLTVDALHTHLQGLSNEQPIVVQVDKQAHFESFVALIDALKQYNLTNLSILTRRE